jgi:hypothetical protein
MTVPPLEGYHVVWSDDFSGAKGSAVNKSLWNQVARDDNPNNEVEVYTDSTETAHLSGDGQLYIIPKKHENTWRSARLESTKSVACPAGKAVVFQAKIRGPNFTGSPAKFAGLWPAFWTLGESIRHNVSWPACGEWDIFEVTNKMGDRNQGTLHFLDAQGKENGSFNGSTHYKGDEYHTWALKVDRRNGDFKQQRLTWYLDGTEFYHVTGAMIGTTHQWQTLAYDPYFIILNVAIGGDYPGFPTNQTASGFDASMRVQYVAVYQSN